MMMNHHFDFLSNGIDTHQQSPSSTPRQLKSCLRKGKLSRAEGCMQSPASTALASAYSPSYSPQHSQTREETYTGTRTSYALTSTMGARSGQSYEDDERQFMKMSSYLIKEYNTGSYTAPKAANRLLHHCLPSFHERQRFHGSLLRNVSVLPIFPEPGEHPSFSMTRFVESIFGPILSNEMNGRTLSNNHGNQFPMDQSMPNATTDGIKRANGRNGTSTVVYLNQSPPVDMSDALMFPPPSITGWQNHSDDRIPPMSPNLHTAISTTPQSSKEPSPQITTSVLKQKLQPDSPEPLPNAEIPSNAAQLSGVRSLEESPKRDNEALSSNAPPPQPLPVYNDSSNLLNKGVSTSTIGVLKNPIRKPIPPTSVENQNTRGATVIDKKSQSYQNIKRNHNSGSEIDSNQSANSSEKYSQYQRLHSKDMLPPILPREIILHDKIPPIQSSSPCCFAGTPRRRQRRSPSYQQLYIKCERSEPFAQPDPDMDIVTWYRNSENRVTADRTLVVRGTTSLFDLIRGILQAFGLSSDGPGVGNGRGGEDWDTPSLGCFREICFLSDIKTSTCPETSRLQLTPLPIPGFYYKYVPRVAAGGGSDANESTVLSNDPVGLQRTLLAQLLDTPLFPASNLDKGIPSGRTRLALVYCTPKREAYVSSRTERAILPETIYHFQILLEGMVSEHDLSSSYQALVPIRCVGGTGGVHGGSLIDTTLEVQELNRQLWHNDDDAIREKVNEVMPLPLFDRSGTQMLKECVVDRCLYFIRSGNLSMTIAEKTQGTVEAMYGSTDWLARQMEQLAKSFSRAASSCTEDNLMYAEKEFDRFESVVSKVLL